MYEKKITLKKMVYQAAHVFIGGGITALLNFFQALPTDDPMTQGAAFLIILAILKGAENYLKHRNK